MKSGDDTMEDLILIGSGGCMRELLYQIQELNKVQPTWHVLGYVDRKAAEAAGCRYLGDDDWLMHYSRKAAVCISVQEAVLREKLAALYHKNPRLYFPVMRMLHTEAAETTVIGEGTILCEHVKITNDGTVGKFCFFNIGAQIHHDAGIGDYVTAAPNVTAAGNVTLGNGCYIGMGARVIQGICIGEKAVIGAGAVVVEDIPEGTTAVGVPAKVIKRNVP